MPHAVHRAVVCVDVEGFGDRRRTRRDQMGVRDGVYRSLRAALGKCGVDWGGCYHEDRGDGVLVLVPPEVPKYLLVAVLPQELAILLDRHNDETGPEERIRLRVSVDAGEVQHDPYGVVGGVINRTFRMLDAEVTRSALHQSTWPLVLIASDWFFEEVVRHHPSGDIDAYQRVHVAVKETRTTAWIYAPGCPDLRSDRSAEAHVPRRLPAAVRDFVGRTEELDMLTRLLAEAGAQDRTAEVAVITGTAGVGKTALALEWAHQVRGRFPDGDLYVNLCGFAPGPPVGPERALDDLLRDLGLSAEEIPADVDAKAKTYRSLLAGRRILIILDNAADAEQTRPLLPDTPGCLTVVTSRNSLAGLVVRDNARNVGLGCLTEDAAMVLLRRLIGTARVDGEAAAAAELARRCGYLPLALRIAAERAARPGLSIAAMAADLADEHDRLDQLDTDDHQTTIRTVFSWSYRALPAPTARVFRLLSLHAGPDIGVHAAAALMDTGPGEACRQLERLVRMNLLETAFHGRRYRFHDLLRCYAAERTRAEDTAGQRAAAVRRLLGWYLHAVEAARLLVFPQPVTLTGPVADVTYWSPGFTTPLEARRWWESEHACVVAAAHQAAAWEEHDLAWRLPVSSYPFFYHRKSWDDWIVTLRIALTSALRIGDRDGEACAAAALGLAYHDIRQSDDAIGYFTESLAVSRTTRNRYLEGVALNLLGMAYRGLHRFEESIDHCGRALDICRELHARFDEGLVLLDLGYSCGGLRRFEAAIAHFQEALAISAEHHRRNEAWAHQGLGYAYRHLGRHGESVHHAERALAIFRETGDQWGQAEALYSLGRAQARSGHQETGRRTLTRALEAFGNLSRSRAAQVEACLHRL